MTISGCRYSPTRRQNRPLPILHYRDASGLSPAGHRCWCSIVAVCATSTTASFHVFAEGDCAAAAQESVMWQELVASLLRNGECLVFQYRSLFAVDSIPNNSSHKLNHRQWPPRRNHSSMSLHDYQTWTRTPLSPSASPTHMSTPQPLHPAVSSTQPVT